MTSVKTIKDVDDATWSHFKSLAARSNMKMGAFFKTMIHEYDSKSNNVWNRILGGEKLLTDKEARRMHQEVKKLRKEYGFRI